MAFTPHSLHKKGMLLFKNNFVADSSREMMCEGRGVVKSANDRAAVSVATNSQSRIFCTYVIWCLNVGEGSYKLQCNIQG